MATSQGNSEPFKFSSIPKRASHGFAKRDAKFLKVPPNCVRRMRCAYLLNLSDDNGSLPTYVGLGFYYAYPMRCGAYHHCRKVMVRMGAVLRPVWYVALAL